MHGLPQTPSRRFAFVLLLVGIAFAGCRWTTKSGLPEHIKTVEIHVFGNTTLEPGLETALTRELKRMAMQDPGVRVVNRGGDAVLTGRIVEIVRAPERLGSSDRPTSMTLAVRARYSFFDQTAQQYLVRDRLVESNQSSTIAGHYPAGPDGASAGAEAAAVEALSREIIRGTLGMW